MVLKRSGRGKPQEEASVASPIAPATDTHARVSSQSRQLIIYGIAVLTVAIAIAVTLTFWSLFDRNPFVLFYAAVMISAWRGGFGPALLSAMLALVAIDFFLMPSFLSSTWRDAVQASLFVGIAALPSWLNHARDRAMADLQRAKLEADEANDAKDQFLAVLSHELRTPLTPVLGLATMLENDPTLSDEVRSDATVIRRNVELEARLIDDLLDITRIRRGKLSLDRRIVELSALIENVVRICKDDAESKQITIRTMLPPTSPMVSGDPARLQQILWNLLKNAIKFTPAMGQVTISCGHTPGGLKVDVIDSGIGIDSSMLPRVFNAFEQGGKNVTRRFGGIGLGLAISKALAEAHGGALSAASEGSGRGACFTLTLQTLALVPDQAEPAPMSVVEVPSLKVLLVEDHADSAEVMTRLLRNLSHQVQHVGSVRAAQEMAETQSFDVVISDIGLPDGSGVDLIQHLSAKYRLQGIAMSGFGMEEDVRRSLCAGFQAHLTKPVNLDLLEAAIGNLNVRSRTG